MKERMQREWVFSVMADQLEEIGEEGLSAFFRGVEAEPQGLAAQMIEHIGRTRSLTYQKGKDNWNQAAAMFAALERHHQSLEDDYLPSILDDAVEAHEDILEDGVVEIDRYPRVQLRAGLYPGGPAHLRVSGWFAVNVDGQGQVQPNPEDDDEGYEEEYYQLDPQPRWNELEHPQRMNLLQTVTGFDAESITITNGEIFGRPYRNYAYAGMKVRWGRLEDALSEAVRIGYIREE